MLQFNSRPQEKFKSEGDKVNQKNKQKDEARQHRRGLKKTQNGQLALGRN